MISKFTYLNESESFDFEGKQLVICIGFFDGIHEMHQKIIQETKQIAQKENKKCGIVTFSQKVSDFLNNSKKNIQSNKIKYNWIKNNYNPDFLIEIQVCKKTIELSPKYFCDFLSKKLNVSKIIIGSDFTFGYMGKGNVGTLKEHFGEENIVIFKRSEEISTTKIRKFIETGDFVKVKQLLNRNFLVEVKKQSPNKFMIFEINTKLKDGIYLIKILNIKLEVEIKNNCLFLRDDFHETQMEIEILQKIK